MEGIQPSALRGADPGGRPSAGVRLADPPRGAGGKAGTAPSSAGCWRWRRRSTGWRMSAIPGRARCWCMRRRRRRPHASPGWRRRRTIRPCRTGLAARPTGCPTRRPPSRCGPRRWHPAAPTDSGLGPVPHAASPAAGQGGALERGSLIHHVLQHAPAPPPAERDAAMLRYLAAAGGSPGPGGGDPGHHRPPGAGAAVRAGGPGGTAAVPGLVNGTVVSGIVDRMAVLPGRVMLADYKTNRDAPARAGTRPCSTSARWRPTAPWCRRSSPAMRSNATWSGPAPPSVMTLPDVLLDTHAPGQLDPTRRNAHFLGRSAGDVA